MVVFLLKMGLVREVVVILSLFLPLCFFFIFLFCLPSLSWGAAGLFQRRLLILLVQWGHKPYRGKGFIQVCHWLLPDFLVCPVGMKKTNTG